ncbi:LysR family transcriptional regulator [Roseobacter sp. HKCCD6265]|uniref:LysR family transcriptional regulator n=2 Tax=unclassified Roseobacter TaxID=196798 RepID=UPI0034614335
MDMWQRRFLPSIGSLLAFDAVMRQGGVTAAAAELHLTQSTVSRLIIGLEETLGVPLFVRERRRLVPTEAAQSYHREIARALDIVQRSSMSVLTNPDGGTISLAVLPTFATRWLGPRLGRFLNDHPGVSVNMSTRIAPVDFSAEAFDAAIAHGVTRRDGFHGLKLLEETVTACAAPGYAEANALTSLSAVSEHPRLQLESRPDAWADWYAAHGGVAPLGGGMVMDQFSMMIQAAISGLGIALLPDYLARIEIAGGRLAPILTQAVPVRDAYWLVWPPSKEGHPPLRALRDWLSGQQEIRAASEPSAAP